VDIRPGSFDSKGLGEGDKAGSGLEQKTEFSAGGSHLGGLGKMREKVDKKKGQLQLPEIIREVLQERLFDGARPGLYRLGVRQEGPKERQEEDFWTKRRESGKYSDRGRPIKKSSVAGLGDTSKRERGRKNTWERFALRT